VIVGVGKVRERSANQEALNSSGRRFPVIATQLTLGENLESNFEMLGWQSRIPLEHLKSRQTASCDPFCHQLVEVNPTGLSTGEAFR
jgi:hypothetical protein